MQRARWRTEQMFQETWTFRFFRQKNQREYVLKKIHEIWRNVWVRDSRRSCRSSCGTSCDAHAAKYDVCDLSKRNQGLRGGRSLLLRTEGTNDTKVQDLRVCFCWDRHVCSKGSDSGPRDFVRSCELLHGRSYLVQPLSDLISSMRELDNLRSHLLFENAILMRVRVKTKKIQSRFWRIWHQLSHFCDIKAIDITTEWWVGSTPHRLSRIRTTIGESNATTRQIWDAGRNQFCHWDHSCTWRVNVSTLVRSPILTLEAYDDRDDVLYFLCYTSMKHIDVHRRHGQYLKRDCATGIIPDTRCPTGQSKNQGGQKELFAIRCPARFLNSTKSAPPHEAHWAASCLSPSWVVFSSAAFFSSLGRCFSVQVLLPLQFDSSGWCIGDTKEGELSLELVRQEDEGGGPVRRRWDRGVRSNGLCEYCLPKVLFGLLVFLDCPAGQHVHGVYPA